MNAQTAAVYDFQTPMPFRHRPRQAESTFKLRFKSRVSAEVEIKLTCQLLGYATLYKGTDCNVSKTHYLGMADGFLEGLILSKLVDLGERSRAMRLFMEQADLFDDRQVA